MCGLDCGVCPAFIAFKNNDDKLREKTAREWTEKYRKDKPPIRIEEINCGGCISDGPFYTHCFECKVRLCGLEKKIKNCQECKDYKCEKLSD